MRTALFREFTMKDLLYASFHSATTRYKQHH